MARRNRLYIEGMSYFISHRGKNGTCCFGDEEDYQYFIDRLTDALSRYSVALHAFALLPNEVMLLASPSDERGIPDVMKFVGVCQTRHVNDKYGRTGTLWEGRYKASLVQPAKYVLLCQTYIERAPVRHCLSDHPGQYQWSSFAFNGLGTESALLSYHFDYQKLGGDRWIRCEKYRQMMSAAFQPDCFDMIDTCLTRGRPLVNSDYRAKIGKMLKVCA